ncbi:MAG: hypothetical protein M0C28_41670 [Candidatus Moduliflexus flocculans]|nr:hypothetical protein [Candidatus Moduliflexus flocculans]
MKRDDLPRGSPDGFVPAWRDSRTCPGWRATRCEGPILSQLEEYPRRLRRRVGRAGAGAGRPAGCLAGTRGPGIQRPRLQPVLGAGRLPLRGIRAAGCRP